MSRQAFLVDCDCNTAMARVDEFLVSLGEEVSSILASIGVNDSMSALLNSAALCWDWSRVVFERPAVADVQAFRCAALLLRLGPTLRTSNSLNCVPARFDQTGLMITCVKL